MTSVKSATGKVVALDKLVQHPVPITLDPVPRSGSIVRGVDNNLYMSNGTAWVSIAVSDVDDRLSALENITVSGLAVSGGTIYEKGLSITPTLTWTVTGPVAPVSQTVNSTVIDPALRTYIAPAITNNSNYTVAATPPNGNVSSTSVSVSFRNRVFWGTSANQTLTSAQVIALGNSELATARQKTMLVPVSTESYVYYAYPSSWGAPSTITAYGFNTSFVTQTISVTTSAGHTESYLVCRLTQTQSVNVPLVVS